MGRSTQVVMMKASDADADAVCVFVTEPAVDDDADKSASDNVRLSVTIDENDYDIRSEAGASVDGDNKDKETERAGNSDAADAAGTTTAEGGTGCRVVVLLRFQNVSCRSVSVGFAEKTSVFGSV